MGFGIKIKNIVLVTIKIAFAMALYHFQFLINHIRCKDLSSNFLLKILKKPQPYGYTTSFFKYFYLKNFCLNL